MEKLGKGRDREVCSFRVKECEKTKMPGTRWHGETKSKAQYLILGKWDIHTANLLEYLEKSIFNYRFFF